MILEILLIVGCVSIVVGVVVSRIIARKKGKPTCDCGCSDCSACAACRRYEEKKEDTGRRP